MASGYSLAQFTAGSTREDHYESVDIDPQYAEGLGFSEGDLVDIGLLHDLKVATMVGTEPVSSDDWDIIEIHASHVESTLLSQVRVAQVGQELDVWVLGRTRVRLKAVSIDPSGGSSPLLLSTNTEISIAPKLSRSRQPVPPRSSTQRKTKPTGNAPVKSADAPVSLTLRTLPPRFLSEEIDMPDAGGASIAFVAPFTLVTLLNLPSTDNYLFDESAFFQAKIRHTREPVDPSAESQTPEEQQASQKVVLSDSNRSQGGDHKPQEDSVYVAVRKDVPPKHIVFMLPGKNIKDWGMLRISLMPESTHFKTDRDGALSAPHLQHSLRPALKLAGVEHLVERSVDFCLTHLKASHPLVASGAAAILITGRSGAGKTSFATAVSAAVQRDHSCYSYVHTVDLSTLVKKPIGHVKAQLSFAAEKAMFHRPSILILDNLDKLIPTEVEHSDSFRSRHLAEIFLNIFSSSARSTSRNMSGVVVLATAAATTSLHPFVNASHLFHQTIDLKPPTRDARRDILSSIVQERLQRAGMPSESADHPLNYAALATNTEGYSATDLQDLVTRAMHQMAMRQSKVAAQTLSLLIEDDFEEAQRDFVPLSLRDIKLEKSSVVWSDIGGLEETKRVLRETLEWPTKYGPIFSQAPLRLRSGLLLYGYPGCGKTLLASAVAKECGLNFISVKGPELLNKYIGASEKSVRDIFDRASAAKPCVLFFDEFDSIAPKRGHDSTGVTDRVVNQMLTQMDGAEGLEGVYVLAATSRPDLIDGALLRPGRLDKSLLCGMPTLKERSDILHAVSRKVPLTDDVDLDEMARKTEGFSGADLQALVYNANLEVIHDSIVAEDVVSTSDTAQEYPLEHLRFGGEIASKRLLSKAEDSALQRRLRQIQSSSQSHGVKTSEKLIAKPRDKRNVTPAHFSRVLQTTRPSLSMEEVERLRRVYNAFVSDRESNLDEPTSPIGIGQRVTLG